MSDNEIFEHFEFEVVTIVVASPLNQTISYILDKLLQKIDDMPPFMAITFVTSQLHDQLLHVANDDEKLESLKLLQDSNAQIHIINEITNRLSN